MHLYKMALSSILLHQLLPKYLVYCCIVDWILIDFIETFKFVLVFCHCDHCWWNFSVIWIGGEKLGLKGPLKIVLKTDGTEIEDDSVLLDPRGLCSGVDVVLIILQADESWSNKLTKQRQKNFPSKSMSGILLRGLIMVP